MVVQPFARTQGQPQERQLGQEERVPAKETVLEQRLLRGIAFMFPSGITPNRDPLFTASPEDLDKLDEATKEFREILHGEPACAEAHYWLGQALFWTPGVESSRSSITEFREAVRLKPSYAKAYVKLADALLSVAISSGSKSVGEAGTPPLVIVPNGKITSGDGDQEDYVSEAVAAYRQALRLEPGSALGHGDLGSALLNNGDMGGAIAEFREKLRLSTDDHQKAEAHYDLGRASLQKGDRRKALEELRSACSGNPAYCPLYENTKHGRVFRIP